MPGARAHRPLGDKMPALASKLNARTDWPFWRGPQRNGMWDEHIAQLVPRILGIDPLDVRIARPQHLDRPVGIADADQLDARHSIAAGPAYAGERSQF